MSAGLMNRIKHWVSGDPFDEDMYGYEADFETDTRNYASQPTMVRDFDEIAEPKKPKRNLKVLDHPSSLTQQVLVIEPKAFEEALGIIEHLREKKSVLLNLHMLDTAQSQRVVDFLSGATHAIDGNQQRIGDGVFMFTPSNVVITSEAAGQAMAPQTQSGLNLGEAFWNQSR